MEKILEFFLGPKKRREERKKFRKQEKEERKIRRKALGFFEYYFGSWEKA